MLGADDSLDVFGVHGVGGIIGALLTGVFNKQSLGGPGLVGDWVTARSPPTHRRTGLDPAQGGARDDRLVGVVACIAYKIVDLTIGLRVRRRKSAKASTSRRTARRRTTTDAACFAR